MKKLYTHFPLILMCFFLSMQSLIAQNNQIIVKTNNSVWDNNSSFTLPFNEDWESHSFTTNQWEISDNAWIIDTYTGNGGASAKFKGSAMLTNYSSTLTSNWFAGANLFVGNITLKFDLKLINLINSSTEYMYIKIFDGTSYTTIDSIVNADSFDWEEHAYLLNNIVYGKDFKIVFEAQGISSVKVSGWFIDNIEIYRECEPPVELEGEPSGHANRDELYSIISWKAPQSLWPASLWHHWDSGSNSSGIGLDNGGNYSVAARWDSDSFLDNDGDTITKLKYYLSDDQLDYIILHIWTGENASNIIYSDTVYNPIAGMWNEKILNDIVIIDAALEYWIGYEIINQMPGTFPAGTDGGPAIKGFGDKISTDGESWDNLSDFGLNYNWNIEMCFSPSQPADSTLNKFIIYRSVETDTNYQPYDTAYYVAGQVNYVIYDFDVEPAKWFQGFYKVNAIWGYNGDTCTSPYAKSKLMPLEDFVSVNFTESVEEQPTQSLIAIYPNPVTNSLSVESKLNINEVIIYDLAGKELIRKSFSNQSEINLDVSFLKNGLYLLEISTFSGIITKKFIKK